MDMIFQLALIFSLVVLFLIVAGLTVTVLRIGHGQWREARELSGSLSAVIKGEVEADRDGLPDPRIVKGKIWNIATKSWTPQGKLSDEFVKNMVR